MTSTKATLVLVGGGWHVPASYSKLTNALKSAGYEIHVPSLPSTNQTRPPNADLFTDTTVVREYVERLVDAGRIVVVIMHSYDGQVGTNALHGLGQNTRSQKGLIGGISYFIYMSAFALPKGGSMIDKVKEFGHEHLMPLAFDFAEDMSCVSRDPKLLLVGPGVDENEVEAYVSTLVRWNGNGMYQELTNTPAWKDIPVAYIYTMQDMTVPLDYQKSMVENLEREGKKVYTAELDTGHCPNLTATKEIVDIIDDILAAGKAS
ncbi:alpha/beta-hydrolase [Mollisia scopiformis]|uniref:Alpha/beta-hydrolase n=1 Tax=Mollisia scopiformis TaxID=149040 RepID=A0A132B596_MOLSC|nr:alpha/beta-hydrolase [Mollisia scopiformis]KUJ07585.1 alpha/beta-hydrolase [Mollisia scopiformis]